MKADLTKLRSSIMRQYFGQKLFLAAASQDYSLANIISERFWISLMKDMFQRKMTYSYQSKVPEMAPTFSDQDTLIVRKLRCLGVLGHLEELHVGDCVVIKDPMNSSNHTVSRLAYVGDDVCWVFSDNKKLILKDSRADGPIPMTDIVGRVIYKHQFGKNHDFVYNNKLSMKRDMPVIFMEVTDAVISCLSKDAD